LERQKLEATTITYNTAIQACGNLSMSLWAFHPVVAVLSRLSWQLDFGKTIVGCFKHFWIRTKKGQSCLRQGLSMITSNPGVVANEQRRKRSFVVRGTGSSQGISTTTYSKRILLQNSGVDFVYSSSLEIL
jgi:hypothetical protein